jgi:hypothetical protein
MLTLESKIKAGGYIWQHAKKAERIGLCSKIQQQTQKLRSSI